MFISDYLYALELLGDTLESLDSICFDKIEATIFGNTFLFYPSRNRTEHYTVNIDTGAVYFHNENWNWREPLENLVVLRKGNSE